MTRLVNDVEEFAEEALAGYAAAEADRVFAVHGGVVRAAAMKQGQVAVVSGGGSGHFPAFAGWVGPGLVSGAACGNIFASPSEGQILSVARAANTGGGVLFVPINYAGDILHFGAASQTLLAEGIDTRTVAVTDDIASGSRENRDARRGIAGSFLVLKIAGAAAEQGLGLDDVARIATAANDATRSFGVAFSGCTLPGAPAPLFQLAPGRIALGLGIHGEPGLYETDLGDANWVADLLIDELFRERSPVPGQRVAVLVNGLGSSKYDELWIVFAHVKRRLEAVGMTLVAPVVGEQVTSLDMAGVSVSIGYLDEELEPLWLAPASAYSFRREQVGEVASATVRPTTESTLAVIPPARRASRDFASRMLPGFERVANILDREADRLGRLDAVAGDGDHGLGMRRGAAAALAAARSAIEQGAGAGTMLRLAGESWSERGGGTSGALWGAGLRSAGEEVGDSRAPDDATIVAAARAYAAAIQERGGAQPGSKTMVDALVPFIDVLERAILDGEPIASAWRRAVDASRSAAEATAEIASSVGRSRVHGDHSIGTPDPGAISFALVVASALG